MSTIKAETISNQLALAHKVLEDTVAGLAAPQLHWQPNGKAHSVAANYVHVIVQEDVIISALLKDEKPLFASTFANATGISEIPPLPTTELVNWHEWGERVQIDLEAMFAYRQAVYQNTADYLASVNDVALDESIDTGFLGEMSKFDLINLTVLTNCNWHTGEISTVKGLQGLQGYPF